MTSRPVSPRSAAMILLVVGLAACGSGTSASTAAKSPIEIGVMLELSGPFAANGAAMEDGWKLAVRQLGDTVDGHHVDGIITDEQGDPNVALTQARQLVQQDDVAMLEGPVVANAEAAVEAYAGPLGVPVDDVGICSAQQYGDYQKYGNALSSAWSCDQPALVAGQYAYSSLGYRKVTTIALDYSFGWENVGSFAATFEKAGGKVEKELWAPTSTTDWAPYISQIPKDTDAVFALLAGATSITFTNAYQQFGLKARIPLIGTTTLVDQSILPHSTPSAMLGVKVAAQYCDGVDNAANRKFATAYYKAYGSYPGYYSEEGYTKYERVIAALKQLGGSAVNKKALVNALRTARIDAPRGPLTFSPATRSPIQDIYICQVEQQNGVLRNLPIQTFKDVQPWGSLAESAWLPLFFKDGSGRPSA